MGKRKKIRRETKDHIYPALEEVFKSMEHRRFSTKKKKKKENKEKKKRKKNSETIVASIGSITCEAVRLISSYSGHTGSLVGKSDHVKTANTLRR